MISLISSQLTFIENLEFIFGYQELLDLEAIKKKNVVIGKLQLWIMLRQLLGGMEFSAARNKQDPEKNMEI